jgi:hypothetical protein
VNIQRVTFPAKRVGHRSLETEEIMKQSHLSSANTASDPLIWLLLCTIRFSETLESEEMKQFRKGRDGMVIIEARRLKWLETVALATRQHTRGNRGPAPGSGTVSPNFYGSHVSRGDEQNQVRAR